ncbi:hypothetical protein [Paenibacillus sp. NPDC057967]|uniref:hypothetical protein n=1 Tax=Paenibacillus sp. NPDC057967 TaxID=3346293 RepID=UPI0036DC50A5
MTNYYRSITEEYDKSVLIDDYDTWAVYSAHANRALRQYLSTIQSGTDVFVKTFAAFSLWSDYNEHLRTKRKDSGWYKRTERRKELLDGIITVDEYLRREAEE